MSKSKVRNVVSVEVDEFQPEVPQSNWREARKESHARGAKLEIGAGWELFTFAILLIGFASLWVGRSNIGSRTEVVLAVIALMSGVALAAITGKYYATESMPRKWIGLIALPMGGILLALSLVFKTNPLWSWFASIGFALTIGGWGIRRLAGESWVRALSLGLVFFIPFSFLKDSILPDEIQNSWEENAEQLAFWYGGVWADYNKVPFTPISDSVDTGQANSHCPKREVERRAIPKLLPSTSFGE